MPRNSKREDLRVKKTISALLTAMHTLLTSRNFMHVTVNDICEEAEISRATFYVHYNDKYDLLEDWLRNIKTEFCNGEYSSYAQIEKTVNEFVCQNKKVIKNIVEDANSETLGLIYKWILLTTDIINRNIQEGTDAQNIVLSNFFAGGVVYYLTWQVKNKFPPDIEMMNEHVYHIMRYLLHWDAK